MGQPSTYLARVEFGPDNYQQDTAFTAPDDQTAIQNGRACREVVADAYCKGFTERVRVRVFSLELGGWDPDGGGFATTSDRQLLDTWEDDAEARRPIKTRHLGYVGPESDDEPTL